MEDYTQVLQDSLDMLELNLKRQLLQDGRKASGETIDSIRNEVTPSSGRLVGSGVLYYLIYGRGPSSGAPGQGENTSPSLYQQIKLWVRYKGIPAAAAWPIAQSIHKRGTLLFQGRDSRWPGQRTADTLEQVINQQTLGDIRARLGTAARKNVASELINLT